MPDTPPAPPAIGLGGPSVCVGSLCASPSLPSLHHSRSSGPPAGTSASGTFPRFPPPVLTLVGSWNVSWWVPERLIPAASLGAQVLALHETKLAPLHLASAQRFLRP